MTFGIPYDDTSGDTECRNSDEQAADAAGRRGRADLRPAPRRLPRTPLGTMYVVKLSTCRKTRQVAPCHMQGVRRYRLPLRPYSRPMLRALRKSGRLPTYAQLLAAFREHRSVSHPGVELRTNFRSISHRCHFFEEAFAWELTKGTIHLTLGCLQGGSGRTNLRPAPRCLPRTPLD